MPAPTRWLVPLIGLAAALPAAAQFSQYSPAGAFEERRETREEQLAAAVESARWRLGRLYLDPWIGLRDLSYVRTPAVAGSQEVSDVTASLGVGVRAYLPVGGELTLAAHALPEYVWWRDLAERRRLSGRLGIGLFGNLGRTGIEATATRTDESRFFSREREERVNTRQEIGELRLELEAGRLVSLFAGGSLSRLGFREDDPGLAGVSRLDRDERVVRAGLAVQLTSSLQVSLGAERSEAEFEMAGGAGAPDLSNEGTAPILLVDFDREPLFVSLDLALRSLEPTAGSAFVPYDEVTGSLRAAWRPLRPLQLQLFGSRNLVYSLSNDWAYFTDTTLGAALVPSLSSWSKLQVFVEGGSNDYEILAPGTPERRDDFTAWGAGVTFTVGRLTLGISGSRTEYESNLSGFDRTVTTVGSSISLAVGGGGGSPWG